jgi:hypothetical protein
MSAHESSELSDRAPRANEATGREPRLGQLTLAMLLGPIAALSNQQAIYAANPWVCGHGARVALHSIPILALLVTGAAAVVAVRARRRLGGVRNEARGLVFERTYFLALLGIALSLFSAVVVVAQWLAVFTYDPCMRL